MKRLLKFLFGDVETEEEMRSAPCGNPEEHYYWVDCTVSSLGCPVCARIHYRENQKKEEQDKIDAISVAVADKIMERMEAAQKRKDDGEDTQNG